MSSSFSFGKNKNRRYHAADNMQYNRAQLMRMQEEGIEIIIGAKPKAKVPPNPSPTVTIKNLNIINQNDNEDNNDNKQDSKDKTDGDTDKTDEKYEVKEDIKRVEIRHNEHWFIMKFENTNEFYEFLDKFEIFGLLAEEKGILIITNYNDLSGDNKKYRTVKFARFDRWTPFRIESKNDECNRFYSDVNCIKKKGICTKVEKTIGIRHHYVWLQLTFRFEWEFDKFIFDSQCYGLVDEHSRLIVRKFQDLQQSDYRLANIHSWDEYNVADFDGSYSGSITVNTVKSNKKKKSKNSSASTGWWS